MTKKRNKNISSTPDKVASILKTFNLNKAIGPNSLPVKILKDLKSEITGPWCTLVNLLFNTGVFWNSLKLAKIISIFKKGNQKECNNYRPISLLSNISKLIGKLLYDRINFWIEKCLYKYQFGFRNHYSTNHAFVSITEKSKKHWIMASLTAESF